MVATTVMFCGCFTSRSMFGEWEVLEVGMCPYHAVLLKAETDALASKVFEQVAKNPAPPVEPYIPSEGIEIG